LIRFAILALAAVALLIAFWPPGRGLLLFLLGRASTCSLKQSIRAVQATAPHLAAAQRFQRTSRLVDKDAFGLELWDTEQGRFWIITGDDLHRLFVELAEQQVNIYGSGAMGVHPGDIVLDCGAQYGIYTRKALRAGARLVVAVEPSPQSLGCLRRTLAPEIAEGRVLVYPKGVWDRDDILTLNLNPRDSATDSFVFSAPQSVAAPNIRLTTIDRMVSELKLPSVDFIKMDIEGAERRAILGAANTLARYKPRLAICVYHLPDDPVTIPKLVRQAMPAYRSQCGLCTDWGFHIRNDVMHFY
jgi:FkbM family methyltransferase